MPKLKKTNLLQVVENAIRECGWHFHQIDPVATHPFRLKVSNEEESINIRVYIWNLSHGGGAKRPKHEYRIQVTGINRFERDKNEKSLILGWWEDQHIFAGFDYSKHTSKLGFSPSMQISEDTLLEASIGGIKSQEKTNGEIVVAFRPDYFIDYVLNLENYHSISKYEIIDESENEIIPFRFAITSYGADYPVDSLVQRINDNIIFVPPFQRNFVWDINRSSKFIESLILGLPVPGIFLSKEKETGRLLIIDGQQRLLTLYAFKSGKFKQKPFKLQNVQNDLAGKTYDELSAYDKNRLNDSIIHATVIRQDDPSNDESSIYLIYERLNTGGKLLNAQEIRASIYYGEFNELLNDMVKNLVWREIFGKPNERLKEQELILRFFALYYSHKKYEKPMKLFLNGFMAKNRHLQIYSATLLSKIFHETINFIYSALGKNAFKIVRGINTAVFDAVMVGTAIRIKSGEIKSSKNYTDAYYSLINNNDFASLTRGGTTDDIVVKKRINLAIEQFAKIK